MRRAWILLIAATGCFAPDPAVGVPCSADEHCPDGQFCVAHDGVSTCELQPGVDPPPPPPPPPASDRDGDGVADDDDNCPDLPNADQADEDFDRAGDGCDPCPISDDNTDGDGDGLGDACDPNPATAGDTLVAFEGFDRDLPPDWTVSGTFNLAGGNGVAMSSETSSTVVTIASPPVDKIEIRAEATLLAITATGQNLGAINVVDRLAPDTDNAIACQLSRLSGGDQQQLRIFDTSAGMIVDTGAHSFDIGIPHELRLRRAGTNFLCHTTSPGLELGGAAAFSPQDARIGLRAIGAVAVYHWVMIVASP